MTRQAVRLLKVGHLRENLGPRANRSAVFQYTYKRPGEEKEYVVVWDYNVGLVRMTPFFKSLKYSKVSSGRMMSDRSLTTTDRTSKSPEREPGAEGHQLQYYRRCACLPRSVRLVYACGG